MVKPLVLASLSLLAVGCGPYLQYRAQRPSPTPAGKIVVEVRDDREPKAGGNNKEEVGVRTGPFGIPDEIRVESPTAVAETMYRLMSEAALSAGVGVATPGQEQGATARVVLDIQRFWCTGYHPAYKGDITASLSVLDASGQQVRVPGQPVHAEDGGRDCRRIYRKALSDFFVNARALLSIPQVREAAIGGTAQPMPPR